MTSVECFLSFHTYPEIKKSLRKKTERFTKNNNNSVFPIVICWLILKCKQNRDICNSFVRKVRYSLKYSVSAGVLAVIKAK